MIKLYLDEDIPTIIASILRKRGYDVISTVEAKMQGNTDEKQLQYAHDKCRCIVTRNVKDFISLAKIWENHSGIVLTKKIFIKELVHSLTMFIETKTENQIKNTVFWV